jgi:CRISPR-associated endonuclease/helicase Cas3
VLHLSTLLCGAHRRRVIAEVKRRLEAGEPCLLVSTQVIEAGVDLDFPLVLRALGSFDSIIQAAGRCNREGNPRPGRVVVFEPAEGGLPPGAYRIGKQQTQAILAAGDLNPDDLSHVRTYFERWPGALGDDGIDRERIQECRRPLDYPETARRFRMIDDDTESVVVTGYGSEEEQPTYNPRSCMEPPIPASLGAARIVSRRVARGANAAEVEAIL